LARRRSGILRPEAALASVAARASVAVAVAFGLAFALATPTALAQAVGLDDSFAPSAWTDLFDHRSIKGWVVRGPAKFDVVDGVLVGHAVASATNSFLCTEANYDDFVLEVEFRCDAPLNSGVQVHSEFVAGHVQGHQVEIDADVARGRLWSGGIYDEGRKGWLDPADGEKGAHGVAFSEQGRKIANALAEHRKREGWSWLHVVARGSELTVWLDGELRGHVRDAAPEHGFLALLVHAVDEKTLRAAPDEELAVRFRTVRIHPLPEVGSGVGDSDASRDAVVALDDSGANRLTDEESRAGWRLLWDGANEKGWRSATDESFPRHGWTMHDGVLTVGAPTVAPAKPSSESAAGGDLLTRDRFSSFELRVDFRLTPGANSGIKYFVQPDLRPITATGEPAAVGSAIGCEFQLLDDERHPDAKLGRDGNRTLAALYDLIPPAAGKPARPIGDWNTARIVARGAHVEHWLNGTRVLEYDRASDAFRALVQQSKYKSLPHFGEWRDGHVLLQEHGSEVSFRNVKIRVLPD
jgi:hypothetical protein